MKVICALAVAAVLAGAWIATGVKAQTAPAPAKVPDALNFSVKDIDGNDVALSKYLGKVIMIVNVASKCGNTPQYAPMEKMYDKLKDKGFVILGFPANNFGSQEPGSNAQIKEFCEETYKVAFPMFAKISVKGNDMAPLYKYLTVQDCKPLSKGDVAWNFEKFLISKDGKLVGRFANKMQPDDPVITAAIDAELAK